MMNLNSVNKSFVTSIDNPSFSILASNYGKDECAPWYNLHFVKKKHIFFVKSSVFEERHNSIALKNFHLIRKKNKGNPLWIFILKEEKSTLFQRFFSPQASWHSPGAPERKVSSKKNFSPGSSSANTSHRKRPGKKTLLSCRTFHLKKLCAPRFFTNPCTLRL